MKDTQILSPAKRKRTFLLSTSKKTNADDRPNSTQLDAASPKIILQHWDEHSTFIDCSTDKSDFNAKGTKDIMRNSKGQQESIAILYQKGCFEDCDDKYSKEFNSGESRPQSPSSTSHSHSQLDSPCVNSSSRKHLNGSDDFDDTDVIVYTDYENDSNQNSIVSGTDNIMKKELESLQIEGKRGFKSRFNGNIPSTRSSDTSLCKLEKSGSYMENLFNNNEFDPHASYDLDDHIDGNSLNSGSSIPPSPCIQRNSFIFLESEKRRFRKEDYLTSYDSDDDRHLPIKNWQSWRNSPDSSIDVDDQDTVSNDVAGHLSCLHIKRTRTVLNDTSADECLDEESDSTSLRSFVNSRNKGTSRRERVEVNDSSTSFVDTLITSHSQLESGDGSPVLKSPRRSNSRAFKMKDNKDQNGQIISNPSSSPTSASREPSPRIRPSQFVSSTATITPHTMTPTKRGSMSAADFMGDLGTPVKEVGSPADIDMDTDLEVEENDGVFYSQSRHTNGIDPDTPKRNRNTGTRNNCNKDYNNINSYKDVINNPGKYEENFEANHASNVLNEVNMDSIHNVHNVSTSSTNSNSINSISSNHEDFIKKYTNYDFKNIYSSVNYDNDENNDSDEEFQRGKIQHAHSYDISDRDYSIDSRRGNFTLNTFPSYSSSDSYTTSFTSSNDKNGIKGGLGSVLGGDRAPRSKISPRPLPDQSAFNAVGSLSYRGPETPVKGPVCPATPIRTPLWKSERSTEIHYPDSDNSTECSLYSIPRLMRQSSLTDNKVLVSLSESISTSDVSFSRDFESEGFLGSGNFSDVYKVKEKDGKVYAVKKSKRQFRSKKDRALFMGEVNMMKKMIEVPCKNIVKLIRAWQEDGYFFVQLDLAERGTLKELFINLAKKKEYLEESTIWHIVHDVASGLQHIHQCGVVHLDVKPANLLISAEGVIKIGDFGMASDIGKGEDGHEGDSGYMAPELLDSSDRDTPADVFSLGLALYESCIFNDHSEMVANGLSALPSEGPGWHMLRHGEAPSVSVERYSETLCSLITGTMRPRPMDRPTTENILKIPQVMNTTYEVDKILQSASNITVNRLVRSGSFKTTMNLDLNSDGDLQVVTGPFGNPNLISSTLNWHDDGSTPDHKEHSSPGAGPFGNPNLISSTLNWHDDGSTVNPDHTECSSPREPRIIPPRRRSTGAEIPALGLIGMSTNSDTAVRDFLSSRSDVSGLYTSRSGFYSSRTDQSATSSRTNSLDFTNMLPTLPIESLNGNVSYDD
eukprot:CAMPEP_0119054310 /NCGR_PEP_ID=MMETSP1177-20130426/74984_1 /TAXON_ID=2985 /ORGANISM="Ochromonas sp, Strain CCMP1899" /LENGTH=1254 /DNA_ID=CAMNT_0007034505 /DNA_START=97 /DNA_END=3861 /DNA_ORIENTATION=+